MAKKKPLGQMNWRPLPEDKKLMAELSSRLGVSESDIIRLGIRSLAKQEGVSQ